MQAAIKPLLCSAAYGATEDGHIVNVCTGRRLAERDQHGYRTVTLKLGGQSIPKLVHPLVYTAFSEIEVPPDRSIDHINRIRHDNRIANLRLATRVQQMDNTESRVGRVKASLHRPLVVIATDGTETVFPRMCVALTTFVAPRIKHATAERRIWSALKTSKAAYDYSFRYADTALEATARQWLPIPPAAIGGASGYQASDNGLIKTSRGTVTCGTLGRYKDYRVINIQRREYRVHRLVADAFLPPDPSRPIVNHIDGNKLNNAASNLERVTASENTQHAIATGLILTPQGRGVCRISLVEATETHFVSVHAAARSVGNEASNIIACCAGRQNTAYGYKWRYQ